VAIDDMWMAGFRVVSKVCYFITFKYLSNICSFALYKKKGP